MQRYWCLTIFATVFAVATPAAEFTTTSVVAVAAEDIRHDPGVLQEQGIVSSGQPDAQVLQRVAEAGFVAVIDLRTDEEDRGLDEKSEVERLGMQYVSLPVAGRDDISFDKAAELDRLLAGFDGPLLVHCGSGNRVGALVALRASLHGANDQDALAAGKTAGMTRLTSTVEERLGHGVGPTQLIDK